MTQPSSISDPLDIILSNALSGKTLFKDRNILRSDYVPDNLPYRQDQITTIGQILSPILQDSKPSNLLLYGKTGSGKTAVAKYVLERFQKATIKYGRQISLAYSNARLAGSEYRVLVDLGQSLSLKIPFTGLPLSEVLQRIFNQISQLNLKTIFVLDEIDFLGKHSYDDILYSLTRSNEHLGGGLLTLIGISNDLNFKTFLDPRVLSSLNEEEVLFPPYTVDQLRDILSERVSLAFNKGAVHISTSNLCAALAGSEHGDARRAVDLLRVAGEVAEREAATKVEDKHVRIASQKIDQDRILNAVKTLPLHEKVVLASVSLLSSMSTTGEVFDKYQSLAKRISLDPLTQRRVSGLLSELDVQGLINANIINHGRHGRTKRITSLVPKGLLSQVFSQNTQEVQLLHS